MAIKAAAFSCACLILLACASAAKQAGEKGANNDADAAAASIILDKLKGGSDRRKARSPAAYGAAKQGDDLLMSTALADLIASLTRKRLNKHIAGGIHSCISQHISAGDSILGDDDGRMPGQKWEDYLMTTLLDKHQGVLPFVACMGLNNLVSPDALSAAGDRLMWSAISGVGMAGTTDPLEWVHGLITRAPSPFAFTLGGHLLERVDTGPVRKGGADNNNANNAKSDPLLSVFGVSPDGFGVLHKALDRDKRLLDVTGLLARTLVERPLKSDSKPSSSDEAYSDLQFALGLEALFDQYSHSIAKEQRAVVKRAAREVAKQHVLRAHANGTASERSGKAPPSVNATTKTTGRALGRRLLTSHLARLQNALSVWTLGRLLSNVQNRREAAANAPDAVTSAAALADSLLTSPHLAQLLGARDVFGRTPLHVAAVTGNAEAVGQLHSAILSVLADHSHPVPISDGSPVAAGIGMAWWPHAAALPWLSDVFGYTPTSLAATLHGSDSDVVAQLASLEGGVRQWVAAKAREGSYIVPLGVCVRSEDEGLRLVPAAAGPAGIVALPSSSFSSASASAVCPFSPLMGDEDEQAMVRGIMTDRGGAADSNGKAEGAASASADLNAAEYIAAKRRRNKERATGKGKAASQADGQSGSERKAAAQDDDASSSPSAASYVPYTFDGPTFAPSYNAPLTSVAAAAAAHVGDATRAMARPAQPLQLPQYSSSLVKAVDASVAADSSAADDNDVSSGGTFKVGHVSATAARALQKLRSLTVGSDDGGGCDVPVIDIATLEGGASSVGHSWLWDHLVPGRPVLIRGLFTEAPDAGTAGTGTAPSSKASAALAALTPSALLSSSAAAVSSLSDLPIRAGPIPHSRRLGLSDVSLTLGQFISGLIACRQSGSNSSSTPTAAADVELARDFDAGKLCPVLTAPEPQLTPPPPPSIGTSPSPPSSASATATKTLKSGHRKKKGGKEGSTKESFDSVYAGAEGPSAAGSRLLVWHRLRYQPGTGLPSEAALVKQLVVPLAWALNASLPAYRGPHTDAELDVALASAVGGGSGSGSEVQAAARVDADGHAVTSPSSSPPRKPPALTPVQPMVDAATPPSFYLYVGGPGSGQPLTSLLAGGGETDRLNVLAAGGATWLLQPPHQTHVSSVPIADHILHLLGGGGGGSSNSTVSSSSWSEKPSLPLVCRQRAGDVLYIPRGWGAGSIHTGGGISSGLQVDIVTPLARY